MGEGTISLDEEKITTLIKSIFQEEFKKQEQNIAKVISGNLALTMQEIKTVKKDISDLKDSLEFTEGEMKEKLATAEKRISKVEGKMKELYDNQLDPYYVEDEMTELKTKVSELEDRSRRNNLRFDGISEEKNETWEDCERKVENLLKNKLGIEGIKIERAHRTKGKKKINQSQGPSFVSFTATKTKPESWEVAKN